MDPQARHFVPLLGAHKGKLEPQRIPVQSGTELPHLFRFLERIFIGKGRTGHEFATGQFLAERRVQVHPLSPARIQNLNARAAKKFGAIGSRRAKA